MCGAGGGCLFVKGVNVVPFACVAVLNPVGVGGLLCGLTLGLAHLLPCGASGYVGVGEEVGEFDDVEWEFGCPECVAPVSHEAFEHGGVYGVVVDIGFSLIPYHSAER